MAGKKTVDSCRGEIEKIVNSLGYYMVDLDYKKTFNGMVLEVIIDNENPITINDCELVSRALDKPLDELDPTNGVPYNLNVSSMGLDRPLKNDYEFNKYLNKQICVKFYSPIDGKKSIEGELAEFDSQSVTLKVKNDIIKIEKNKIAIALPVIKF